MNTNIQAIDFNATQALQEFINKKTAKLVKLFDEIQDVDVHLKVVKPETSKNKEAQVKAVAPNVNFYASKVCDTFEEAVTESLEAIERQIEKHKEKK
ncbi:MAG: ribosome-associated translation inhibitor RaiA [Paludibacteraceae bacterium]|nr:ribosome-associated translation inhibitor RaiA [Paludibacteraceae bacterium]